MPRIGAASRQTGEVHIETKIELDGGFSDVDLKVDTEELNLGGIDTYRHFLQQIFRHAEFGGNIAGKGDTTHHLIEDVGACFGDAIDQALGDRSGIERMWSIRVPLDGSFGEVTLDFGGRGNAYFDFGSAANSEIAGLVQHLLTYMAIHGKFEIHCTIGRFPGAPQSVHHQLEALCKALGRTLKHATEITRGEGIPSTKGVLG